MPLTPTAGSIRGLTFGRGTPRLFNPSDAVDGWLGLPSFQLDRVGRYGGHGDQLSPIHHNGRTVTVNGFCDQRQDRDFLVQEFMTKMVPNYYDLAEDELSLTVAGRTLSCFGRIVARDVKLGTGWGQGSFAWKFQLESSSAFLFGPPQSVTFPLGSPGAGLLFPATFPVTFPAGVAGGSGVVYNNGTAPADAVYVLNGAQNNPGVANGTTGRMARVAMTMGAGESLTMNTRDGSVTLDGADRFTDAFSDLLVDLQLKPSVNGAPGANAIQAIGTPGATPATLSISYSDTYW